MGSLNQDVAARLEEAAELLRQQGANPFRISAYRRAADTVVHLEQDLRELVDVHGQAGLLGLPGVGKGIATAIHELVATGRWGQLERLRGTTEPEQLFQTLPGVGPELARRIHETLHVDTLPALELAAYDGRLLRVPGLGPRRAAALRAGLTSVLGRVREHGGQPGSGPDVELLLDVDREYREGAQADQLPKVAPKRFNPEGEAWLPILHTRRGDWHFTALYSNTPRAHELGRTKDWVVLYFYDEEHQEGQHTVVTETHGPMAGLRVVRGREAECRIHYAG
jgi:hypothetical protein